MKDLLWTYTKTGTPFSTTIPANQSDWMDAFYLDWATHQFGPEASNEIAAIFSSLDKPGSPSIPGVSGWGDDGGGPGAIEANEEPWTSEQLRYGFVSELEALRPEIRGKGNLDRFDYWLKTMQMLRIMGEYGCLRYKFEHAMEDENWSHALEYKKKLARLFEQIITLQIEKVVNVSDLGEIANLEILNWHQLMELRWGAKLATGLGSALPPESYPSKKYTGKTAVKVITRQTQIRKGDSLALKVLIMGEHTNPALRWRPIGNGSFQSIPLIHVARGVYQVTIPETEHDFEYAIQVVGGTDTIFYPASAPGVNQVVIDQDSSWASCVAIDPPVLQNTQMKK
jgi:hypothetical protein